MNIFVVEHKPTGKYLPPVKSGKCTTSLKLSTTPRVFYRRLDALNASRWWAMGMVGTNYSTDWETGHSEPSGVIVYPVEGRKLSDLRICDAEVIITDIGEEIKA